MNRQYHLDWVRVLATLAVFIYHCFMFFNPWAWHVKNNHTDPTYITAASLFMSTWLMPIFFAVSGISSYNALQKRSGKHYLNERIVRLGIPLLFGVLVLTPPQIYLERVSHGQYSGSFFTWFPHYFDGVYLDIGGSGNFAFVGLHLWYLFVLLFFSLLTLPLFLKMKSSKMMELKRVHLYLMSIPLILISTIMDVVNLGGWDVSYYLIIFLYGYYFFSRASFKPVVQKMLPVTAAISIISTLIFIYSFLTGGQLEEPILLACVKAINSWSWLLVLFALADKKLSFSNNWLKYGNQASMPFYVIHQPVIVMLGFVISNFGWSIPVKFVFLMATAFMIITLFYHFIILRISQVQILFGMKGNKGNIKIFNNHINH